MEDDEVLQELTLRVTPGVAKGLQQIAQATGIGPAELADDLLAEALRRRLRVPLRHVP
jgi:hypothetical protein